MNLLLLHGLGQGPGSWDGVLDALGPDPGAACPDLFGLCGGAPDYPALYAALEDCAIFGRLHNHAFGGMPIQLGMCWGHNTKLNCLEYHRDSEINIGASDFILLLAKQEEITDGMLDTAKIQAFRAPAGAVVEVYATSLHYAPCQTEDTGFRAAVVLPKGTNEAKPVFSPVNEEDGWLTAKNKWLLAHPESSEAGQGAYVGLTGENIDIAKDI